MSERPKRGSKQERYTYSWYQPSQKLDRNQEDYFDGEPEVAEDSSSMMGIESTVQESTDGASHSPYFARPISDGIYRPRHHSLGMKSSFLGMFHFGRNIQIRIGAEAAWGALASAGAVALLTRAGPFPGIQLAELGALWGGIASFLWIVVAKLRN